MFWDTKKDVKCTHPKWEVVKEIELPSVVEQMGLDSLSQEDKMKMLQQLQPQDFNKKSLTIMTCQFCGETREASVEQNYSKRACQHQWEINDVHIPSNFEMQCGIDATFEQRQRVASKMVAEDFANAIIRRTTCKLCGEYDESKITVIKDGSSERCAHQWKVLIGDMVEADTDKFTAYGKQYKFMEIRQQVMLTCEICGMISRQDMYSTLSLYKEVPVR